METAVDEVADLSVRLLFRWRGDHTCLWGRTGSADHRAAVSFQYSVCASAFTLPLAPRPSGQEWPRPACHDDRPLAAERNKQPIKNQ